MDTVDVWELLAYNTAPKNGGKNWRKRQKVPTLLKISHLKLSQFLPGKFTKHEYDLDEVLNNFYFCCFSTISTDSEKF